MLKKIFAIVTIALASSSINAMAQKEVKIAKPVELKAERIAPRPDCSVQRPQQTYAVKERLCPKPGDMYKGIELTADQQAKLDKLTAKEAKDRVKQKEKVQKERTKRMEKHDKEVKKILTPAQYAQYKANVKEAKEHRPHGKKDKKGFGKPRKHNRHQHNAPGCNAIGCHNDKD